MKNGGDGKEHRHPGAEKFLERQACGKSRRSCVAVVITEEVVAQCVPTETSKTQVAKFTSESILSMQKKFSLPVLNTKRTAGINIGSKTTTTTISQRTPP